MRAALILLALAACTFQFEPEPVRYTVVRGDTLGEIATAHGVTVDQIRAWNDLEGDLIEVDQVLVLHPTAAPAAPATTAAPRKPRARPDPTVAPAEAPLALPPAKPCLPPPDPSAMAEGEMVGSQGLRADQVKSAFHAFVPHTTTCLPEGWTGRTTVQLDLVIGCDGRVRDAQIFSGGGLSDDVLACLTERMRYAPFPAHDLPDGERARVPLLFHGEGP